MWGFCRLIVKTFKKYFVNRFFLIFALLFITFTRSTESVPSYQIGVASWYWQMSPGIKKTTANMEIFDDKKLTCAIWDVPFNTLIKVTNLDNAKEIIVRVNDRGPAKRLVEKGRIIDLTKTAFEKIANLDDGLIKVKIEILS